MAGRASWHCPAAPAPRSRPRCWPVSGHGTGPPRRAAAARGRPLFAGALALPGAACVGADPALFFPDPGDAEAEAPAVAICAGCPVRAANATRGAVQNGESVGHLGWRQLRDQPATAVTGSATKGDRANEHVEHRGR